MSNKQPRRVIVFSEKLNELREGYETIDDFAGKCGICRQSMAFYMSEKRTPGLEALVKISIATGHSLDWLVFGEMGEMELQKQKMELESQLEALKENTEKAISILRNGSEK